jgi:hypothetical protein
MFVYRPCFSRNAASTAGRSDGSACNLALVLGMMGEIDEGLRLMEPIARSVETTPDVDVVGFMVILGHLHLWAGHLETAAAWFERGVRFAEPDTDNWTAIRSMPGLSSALRRMGRHDEAAFYADRGSPSAMP